jgi:hypothetical protein
MRVGMALVMVVVMMSMTMHMRVMSVIMMLFSLVGNHVKLHRAEVCANDSRGLQRIAFNGQLRQFCLEVSHVEAKIQQRADRHVTADP